MPFLSRLAIAVLLLAPCSLLAQGGGNGSTAADPFLWLEDVEGERPLAWVRERNARTLDVLQGDARFAGLQQSALEILNAADRIATPSFSGALVTNFWQDAGHVRGLWRRTSLEQYRSDAPAWETLLDVDALARDEGKNWVWRGANCLPPADRYCLISLSDGGKDAVSIREYDVEQRRFIEGGFAFPEGKQNVSWLDRNTVLVAREWTPGEVTGWPAPAGGQCRKHRGTRPSPIAQPAAVSPTASLRSAGLG